VFSPAVRDFPLLLLLSLGEGWGEGDAADRLCPATLTLLLIPLSAGEGTMQPSSSL